jgi:mannose-6-phosphate isomerase
MIKQTPFVSEKIWGSERWVVSAHRAGQSLSADGGVPLGVSLGYDYPLLVKVIQADARLSVQLHPDSAYARAHGASRGKTECWYVLGAAEGATVACGLVGSPSPQELRAAAAQNRLEPYLRVMPVRTGDFVHIPAGLVHAAGAGVRLLEIQESSDITYRLCDWGRGREVHLDQGLAALKHGRTEVVSPFAGAFDCPYFSLRLLESASAPFRAEPPAADYALFVVSGSGEFAGETGERLPVHTEDAVVCRGGEAVTLLGSLRVMQIAPNATCRSRR